MTVCVSERREIDEAHNHMTAIDSFGRDDLGAVVIRWKGKGAEPLLLTKKKEKSEEKRLLSAVLLFVYFV